MGIVNCAGCGRFFDLNEVRGPLPAGYVPRCRRCDGGADHMDEAEFCAWHQAYGRVFKVRRTPEKEGEHGGR